MPADRDYAAEQQRLADGGPERDFSLPVPKMPEVRPEVYQDVSSLLFRGFLVLPAEINSVGFVWKSLNAHEFDLIRLSVHVAPDKPLPDRFWDVFIAYSVFMLDGANILPEREQWFPRLKALARELPREAKQQIVRHLSELNRKAAMSTVLVEAYTMESYSRFRWTQVRGLDLMAPSVTGVPGTERLGMNGAQLTWRALNLIEDINADNERDWENAKFVGACFAGKGIQKVYNQDHDRHRKEMEDRIARKDALLRYVYEGVPIDDGTTIRDGRQVIAARTVEDLADQMARDLRGEKDWHDQVVDAHMAQQRARLAARDQQIEELARRNAESFQGRGLRGETSTEGLTREEVQERIQRSRQIQAQSAHRQMAPEFDERLSRHLDRWGLSPSADAPPALPAPAPPPMPPREVGTPFRRP